MDNPKIGELELKKSASNKEELKNNERCSSTALINTLPDPSGGKRCFVASICSLGSDGSASSMLGGRRRRNRRHERGVILHSDDRNRYCTNYYCKTTRSPVWRKGPSRI
ncbi:hypothetical protein S83_069480 [Arachis hypogaea]|nr:uncharacterized protein DS421_20g685550 [Arachis hypogaea]